MNYLQNKPDESLDILGQLLHDKRLAIMHISLRKVYNALLRGESPTNCYEKIFQRGRELADQLDRAEGWSMRKKDVAVMQIAVAILNNPFDPYGTPFISWPDDYIKQGVLTFRDGKDVPGKCINAVKRRYHHQILEMKKPSFKESDLVYARASEQYGLILSGPHIHNSKITYRVLIDDNVKHIHVVGLKKV